MLVGVAPTCNRVVAAQGRVVLVPADVDDDHLVAKKLGSDATWPVGIKTPA